jgi:formate dehydrogenase iron-sulfur subunit
MISKKALLIDTTMCIGCNACQDACKKEFNLSGGDETTLSATAYTALEQHGDTFVRRMCQHCLEPTCVSVCPVGAFTKTEAGPVLYDESKCIGCRYCIQACPFQVPRYEWSSNYPRVQKCRFCADRIARGLQTACAEACPTGATKFGDRDELIATAYERFKADPTKYYPKIYGIQEAGGTSVLYLASVPFEQLGFKTKLQNTPFPMLTWNALSKIPSVVSVGGVFLSGIWWITNRRMKFMHEAGTNKKPGGNSNGNDHES